MTLGRTPPVGGQACAYASVITDVRHPGLTPAISDEDLMLRVQADDIVAFKALYDRYRARVFSLARLICRDPHWAEEAAQDGFLAVWRSRQSYDAARGCPRAWVMTLVRHRSIDVMRRAQLDADLRDSDGELEYLPAPDSVAEEAEQNDEATRIRDSLRRVPALQREVITLAYFGGLTHTEIATRLRLPAGTVKGRMRLGLHRLRAEIDPVVAPQAPPSLR